MEEIKAQSITTLNDLKGKTIFIARKSSSYDKKIVMLQFGFTDGSECAFVADNPSVGINLVDDSEHVLAQMEKQLSFAENPIWKGESR